MKPAAIDSCAKRRHPRCRDHPEQHGVVGFPKHDDDERHEVDRVAQG
jgi:hypothetical protein